MPLWACISLGLIVIAAVLYAVAAEEKQQRIRREQVAWHGHWRVRA